MDIEYSAKDAQRIVDFILQKDTFTMPEEPVDRKTLSKQVQTYCLESGILEQRGRRLYRVSFRFLPLIETLPPECLWLLIRPMLTREIVGYDITTHPDWSKLSLKPPYNRRPSESYLSHMRKILWRLHTHGYIDFKYIDDVWEIRKRITD